MLTDNNTAIVSTPAADAVAPVQPVADAAPAAKRAKPAKPADKPASKPVATDADAEAARCEALRALARTYYNGASVAAHQRKPAKLADYVARVSTPVQRIGPSGASTRDESGLALIASVAKRDNSFDPCAINLDLGIASRLSSGGFITVSGERFSLTKPGRERANLVIKRAA